MKRYFFTIDFLLPDSDPELLAGRSISVLHGFLIRRGLKSFPLWSQDSIGHAIGFTSTDAESLCSLCSQPYFESMSLNGFFNLSEVAPVPDGLGEVRFVRNQGIAKCFVGEQRRRLARAKRRAEARGEVFDPKRLNFERELEHFHRAVMYSQSKEQRFILHVQKEQAKEGAFSFEFNHYGLATKEQKRGTVPELRSVITQSIRENNK